MNDLENIINLTLIENNITKAIDKENPIMIVFENSETSLKGEIKQIPKNLKG